MSVLNELNNKEVWHSFLNQKIENNALFFKELNDLKDFIDNEKYKDIVQKLNKKEFCFSVPEKIFINKMGSNKKRVVYSFQQNENYILKVISYLLHKYDYIFSPNLYSFRQNYGVKDAINNLKHNEDCYCYKVDIKNYFNSIDVEILIKKLNCIIDDDNLMWFFKSILRRNKCVFNNEIVEENTGGMAGVPISSFFANVYLKDVDDFFYNNNIVYARYSDDILIFANTEEDLLKNKQILLKFLTELKLTINTDKENFYKPNEAWEFLGISCNNKKIDLSSATIQKIKGKIRRKCRALFRWYNKKNVPMEKAVKATIKIFNRKFYDINNKNELSWCRWFFPVITTDEGLKTIDLYFEENLRYIATGKHTKKNYKKLDYNKLKELGFIPLVSAYWKFRKQSENN